MFLLQQFLNNSKLTILRLFINQRELDIYYIQRWTGSSRVCRGVGNLFPVIIFVETLADWPQPRLPSRNLAPQAGAALWGDGE